MNNDANDCSRNDLIQWVNEIAKTQLTKVEQMGTGAVYCQIFDQLHPGRVPMQKVNLRARNDYEFVSNFKILQQCFTRLNIIKPIEIERLVKCKYQDNLEFLQWVRRYFEEGGFEQRKEESVRGTSRSRLPPKVRTEPASFLMSKNSSSSNLSVIDQEVRARLDVRVELQAQVDSLKTENEHYFNKLRDIDALLDSSATREELVQRIRQVLYQTPDRFISVKEDGVLEIQN